ncbi:LacI family DNA-binding transcriptional regulator [Compostimonas suwonensis]|uniref:DNA-binding LacI/PurR family transcriptional regulator n=1 Tax=Compostimonas suwonensis TaxID=1048394 RepID=A0A2M9C410_9MICO|nr:LacI family DNA-binding transcriptional regulator [Compostimonas suwonensis]PJJ65258.1 DNA-binding LacI/PurR family transcriptional regulator [Compostimonas suwonensis]
MSTPRSPRPTLAGVARLAGVSPSTASLAFSGSGPVSDATRERVLAAAETLGYAGPDPRAQSLRRGRSGIVGVVIEDRIRDAFRDPVTVQMLDGLSEEIGSIGASLLLIPDTGEGPADVGTAPMDAAVLIGCTPRLAESLAILSRRGIPTVAIEADPGLGDVGVSLDNRQATRRGAEHLRSLGHTMVALVVLPLSADRSRSPLTAEAERAGTSHVARERILGARDVYPDAPGVVTAGSFMEEGRLAGLQLLARPEDRPTAVIAQSDLLAAGVVRAAEELGIAVPQQLSVLGFDGVRVDGIAPYDLTTLVQPAVPKGRAAGAAVVALLTGADAPSVAFESVLHLGNTTAPPAAR